MKEDVKLPVFIVCGKSPIKSYGGGYSTFAINLARILNNLGHKVFIVAIGEKNEKVELDFCTLLIFKILFFDYYTTALPSLPFSSFIFANGIKREAQEKHFAKFIIWGIGPWGLSGVYLKREFNEKVILINNYFTTIKHEWGGSIKALRISDYGILKKIKFLLIYYTIVQFLTLFEERIIKRADIIVTNYRSTEEILKKQFSIGQSKFFRTTFLTQVYSRQAKEGKIVNNKDIPKKYILYLSRHDPRKGINFLLHTMKILVEQGVTIPLVIAGTGQMLNSNKKLANKLGIHKHIKFLGFVNNSKLLLKKAEIFCFPTIEEGAGALIINEVMSLGVPIVSTECDGIREDIKNEHSGLLVPMANPKQMAYAIKRLLNNRSFARNLGKNAKKDYKKRFNYFNMKQDIENLLSRVPPTLKSPRRL
ncbi:MAG: glycosyltransferase family 4 protein [Candidatus Levybacteria bacterium]|nr:glycosyltransferase family 4 protein [Candidatus Levybacteria bacterium]